MALKGTAKADWQRAYMRRYRLAKRAELEMAKMNWEQARRRGGDYFEAIDPSRHNMQKACAVAAYKARNEDIGPLTPDAEGYQRLQTLATRKGYQKGWAAHQFKRRFGIFPWGELNARHK